jgi:hypothetical protein
MFLLPCRTRPARSQGSAAASPCLAVRDVLCTEYLPDPKDGIGRWTEADFVSALIKGTSPERTHYFPAFPYTSYQHAKVEDIRDLFAWLKTLAPVSGKVRDHDVPFPFNIRRNIGIWKLLFMDGKPFVPDAARSTQWNRGAYLVNASAIAPNATARAIFSAALSPAQRFAGGPNPEGEGWVPNITQKGLGDWSEKDIAYFLETGQTPDGDSAGGSMARVIKQYLAIERRGSRRDSGLHQIAAAGGWTAAAAEALADF